MIKKVVGAVLRREGRVLLCLRSRRREYYPGVWDVPGGHVDAHEPLHVALARELEEELGIDVDVPATAPWKAFNVEGLEFSLFVIDRWRGEIRNCAPHEHEDIRWVAPEELAHLPLAHPLYRTILVQGLACPGSAP